VDTAFGLKWGCLEGSTSFGQKPFVRQTFGRNRKKKLVNRSTVVSPIAKAASAQLYIGPMSANQLNRVKAVSAKCLSAGWRLTKRGGVFIKAVKEL